MRTYSRHLAAAVTLVLLGTAGCGEIGHTPSPPTDEDASAESRTQTLGEPQEGYPNYSERLVLYLTNRARTEPKAFNEAEPHAPAPPLRWHFKLSQAARWQARHIAEDGCWCEDHSSCCNLRQSGGEVTCSDSPGGCGVTSAGERVSLWSDAYTGENAARGQQSAQSAVDGWIHSSGHWKNMTGAKHQLLGVGQHDSAWVQDFGAGAQPPVIGDGIHWSTSGAQTSFGITYYQPGTGGPQSILAIIDGECHELDLAYGTPELGAFETSVSLDTGCHRYYFHVTDGDGGEHTYPSEGSLAVGMGSERCPLYRKRRPADTCSPSGEPCETGDTRPCYTGPYGTEGQGICEAGTERCIGGNWQGECRYETRPKSNDTCGNDKDDDCDGSVDETCGGGDDAGRNSDAGTDASAPGTDAEGSGGCSTTNGGSPPIVAWLLAVLAAAFARRRRRRYRGRH